MYRYLLDKNLCIATYLLEKIQRKNPTRKITEKVTSEQKEPRNSCYVPGQRGSPRQRPPVEVEFAREVYREKQWDRPTPERRVRIAGLIKGN